MVEKNLTQKENEAKIATLLEDLNFLETYIHDIFDFSPTPLAFISILGVILEINPAFEKISEFTTEEIIGKGVEEIIEKDKIKKIAEETLKKDFVEGREVKFTSKSKKEIPVQVFTRVRKDHHNEKLGYFLSLFDLTNIRRTEAKGRADLLKVLEDVKQARDDAGEEKNKTLAIINNFADGILVLDKSDKILLINPKIKDFFNLERRKIIGKSISKLSNVKSLKLLVSFFNKRKRKDEVFREELNINEDLALEISIVPIIRNKMKVGTLIILHDITREKLIEKMKSEFVSLTAHQLRTPLSTIKWIMRMLLDGELGIMNDDQRGFLEDGYESNERMISLIKDLLNVTKIEEGKYLYDIVLYDIEEIIHFAINFYKEEATKKKIKIKFNKQTEKILKTMLDVEKMKMVIGNLIDNAIKYSLSGTSILISLKYANKAIKFSIKDNGIGISQKQQSRIFDKFFRGVDASKMETVGTGLGLYIAKNIIEAHGGKIWFKSQVNKGSTFYFILPVKKAKKL